MKSESLRPYQYFNKLLGDRWRVYIGDSEGQQGVSIGAYPDQISSCYDIGPRPSGSDYWLVVIVHEGTYKPLKYGALLYSDEEMNWVTRDRTINLSGRRAEMAGRLLVRCAEAIAS